MKFVRYDKKPYLCNTKFPCMLEREFKYFKDNHDELFRNYPNKYLVIQGDVVLLAADNFDMALNEAISNGLEAGTFMIQLCSEGEEAYTQTFHSRVVFA